MENIKTENTFRVTQKFGGGTKGYLYVVLDSSIKDTSEIVEACLKAQWEDFKNRKSGFFGKSMERKKIVIKLYNPDTKTIDKGWEKMKVRWR